MTDAFKAFMGYKFIHPEYSDKDIRDILSTKDSAILNELIKIGNAYMHSMQCKTTAY